MILRIRGKLLKMNDREVKATRDLVLKFMKYVQDASDEPVPPTYWFTFLIMMHVLSQEMLNDFDSKTIEQVMKRLQEVKDDN